MSWYKKSQLGLMGIGDYPADNSDKIHGLQRVVETGETDVIDGFPVDTAVAKSLLQFYKQLSSDGRERFLVMPVEQMLNTVIDHHRKMDFVH